MDTNELIEYINSSFVKAKETLDTYKKEAETAHQRMAIAEKLIEEFKIGAKAEIQKAYQAGYEAKTLEIASTDNSGGTKLVHEKN